MIEIAVPSADALSVAAARFIEIFDVSGLRGNVFAFRAPMGAGKTTFISEVCRQLDSSDEPNSPTFSIVNEYDTVRWGRVYHLDCYRLDGEEEAFEAGIEDYFSSGQPCFVEWPERIGSILPDDAVEVEIAVAPDGARKISILNAG